MKTTKKLSKFEELNERFNPRAIKAYLDRFVHGQEAAKKTLSILGYKHVLNMLIQQERESIVRNKEVADQITQSEAELKKIDKRALKAANALEKSTDPVEAEQLKLLITGAERRYRQVLDTIKKAKSLLEDSYSPNLEDVTVVKSNAILIGGSGVGKTYLFQKLAEFLSLPYALVDLTSMTQSGYHGASVSEIGGSIITNDKNAHLKEYAIILLDEIDKIAEERGDSNRGSIGTKSVQFELLKILEGTQLADRTRTNNMLFIGAGAFRGEVKEGRTKEEVKKTVGLMGENSKTVTQVPLNDQLIEYGLIPELIGRFQSGACLTQLEVKDLVSIAKTAEGSVLTEMLKLFKSQGLKLQVTDNLIQAVAEIAIKKGTGARALNAAFELLFKDLQFDLLGTNGLNKKIKMTEDDLKKISL